MHPIYWHFPRVPHVIAPMSVSTRTVTRKFSIGGRSRELRIEGSRSFLCLFIIFTTQKCPFFQSSVSCTVDDVISTLSGLWPLFPGPLCLSMGVSIFCSHVMDRRCRCEMTVGKSFYFIVTNFSFVIISRKGDFVHFFCEKLMLLIVNDVMVRSCAFSRLSDFLKLCMRS